MADKKYKTARQKPEYVYLDQLNAASKTYIARVVVAGKGRDTLSSKKKTVRFQTLLLKDEKGNRMRGTLFGDQIEAFEEALQYLGEYDISAAPIKFIDENWRAELDQFPYQMAFGSRTVIQPVHPELGPILPNYQPYTPCKEPRKIEARDGKRESFVREIVVTDERANLFHQKVLDRQTRVLDVKYPGENKKIVSIAELRQKKPSNNIQEELLWIEVTIQNAELEKVHAYTGCSNCWKRTNLPLQKRYSCTSCYKKECICTERTTFKFEASDGTGTMAFTTFNDDTERLFRRSAAEIYAIKEARKKSLGKSPVQFQGEENESEPPLSQFRAKKKLCFGGMTPEKHKATQGPEISPGKDQAQDEPVPLKTEKKQAKPITVKSEKPK
uniref:Replication factor A C-terminal domain-containing protein n=1 Tax=Chenopodium quinoa TaxID=63459 RepID=A0A803KV58_CHEQI